MPSGVESSQGHFSACGNGRFQSEKMAALRKYQLPGSAPKNVPPHPPFPPPSLASHGATSVFMAFAQAKADHTVFRSWKSARRSAVFGRPGPFFFALGRIAPLREIARGGPRRRLGDRANGGGRKSKRRGSNPRLHKNAQTLLNAPPRPPGPPSSAPAKPQRTSPPPRSRPRSR